MERHFPVAVVQVTGTMAIATASVLHGAVLTCLAEQPAAVVVDLTGVDLAEDLAGLVLSGLARQAGRWPGCPVLTAGAAPPIAAALDRLTVARTVPVLPDRDAVYARIADCPVPSRIAVDIPATPAAAGQARRLVTDACRRWDLRRLAQRAEIVVSELMANAVQHAGGPVRLTVSLLDRYLRLAVRDGSTAAPRLGVPGGGPTSGGRGLLVVDAYASSWGTLDIVDGKVVWANLRAG